MWTRKLYAPRILDAGIAALLAVALLVALHGGFQVRIGPARMSAHGVTRPLAFCAVLIAFRLVTIWRSQRDEIGAIIGRIGFLALFGALFGTWYLLLVTSCGGADSYGYVSTSRLLRSFRLSQPEPVAAFLPVADPLTAVAPVGYLASPVRHEIVPFYPLGLPIVMAAFGAVFGNGAEFYVSPLLAALAAMTAYGIARTFSDAWGASLSALLVAVTPIFVNQAIQPMSDTAATFWILVTAWLFVRSQERSTGWYVAAGVAAGMAFLTRPALVAAILVFVIVALAFRGARAAVLFAAGVAPFVLLQGLVHRHLYGSVMASGYGTASQIFDLARAPGNISTYFIWINYSLSPVFVLTLGLGAFMCGFVGWWVAAIGLFAGVSAPYLFWLTYDNWQDTRFLLPGIAVATIACGITIRNIVARWAPRRVGPPIVLAIACVAAAAAYRFLDRHHTFALARIEARYPRVGEWIQQSAPPQTIVFAFLHSGSVRFYAGRPTVRWDLMTAEGLQASVAALSARGWHSWAVVDGPDEAAAFWPRVEDRIAIEPKGRVQGVDIVALTAR